MFCNKCGKQLRDENKFCPTCGKAVVQDNVTVVNSEGKRKTKIPLGIVCIVLCVLLVLSAVGNGIQLVSRGQSNNQKPQKDNADRVQTEKRDEKELEEDNDIEIAINDCCFERGSYIVVREGEIFYSTTDSIIHRDKEGNENILYSNYAPTSLYLIGDKLYFHEYETNYLCSINLDGSDKHELFDMKHWRSWAFYKDEVYFIENVVNDSGEAEFFINRYCETDAQRNASFCLGKVNDYSYGSPELLCMDLYNKGSVVFRVSEKREEILNDLGELESYREHYKIVSTDFQNMINIESYVEDSNDYGFEPSCVLTNDFLYVYPRYSVQSIEEYIVKEYMIPTVIPENDLLALKDKMDESQWALIEQRYKKLDINNLSKKDTENLDLYLTYYPVMKSQIVYVLRDGTKDNVRTKLEEYFADVGYTAVMYQEHKELDKSVHTKYYEPYVIGCVNPITKETRFKVYIENYIKSVLGYYENDLLVYAYIDEKWGIFKITEEAMHRYQNDGGIEAELLFEINGEYKRTSNNLSVETHVSGDTLYYSVEYGEQVGSVKLN